jgi:hypothetical protein
MAATVRHAIFETLLADAQFVALLSAPDAVYHRVAPQDARFPFVIVHKQAGIPVWAFSDGDDATDSELWTVKAVDRDSSANTTEALQGRIRTLLHDAPLEVDDYAVLFCRRERDVDYGEVEEGNVIHHLGDQYRVMKEPA